MNIIKNSWILACILMLTACVKDYDNVSFVETAVTPSKLGAAFTITQDNTGLVTITPNGEGISYFLVNYGDTTTTQARVNAGSTIQHRYREGNYKVRLRGVGITGATSEIELPLTVAFRAPENLEMTADIDASNKFMVRVTAKADYETFFQVYFGEVPNETPRNFMEGETITHTYSRTGTFTVRVVAMSGGAATTQATKTVTIVNPVVLPVNFEDATLNYAFINFDGGVSTVVNNPFVNAGNNSTRVGKMVKNPGQPWGGSVLSLGAPINFSTNKIFRMKVYSPRVGAKVLLKVENATNPGINFEKETVTTVANAWEDLVFDYSAINAANSYQNIVLIFELGTMGDGSANFTFHYDDIRLVATLPSNTLGLPLNFESSTLNYNFVNFDGGNATVINNPSSAGINTSSKVARMVKSAGQVWGGSFITLDNPIDFSTLKKFKVKVWSPRVGAKLLLKVENTGNPAINFEREATTTTANQWEELTFDYTAINASNAYQRLVFIFDLGTMGDGSANFTYYFDDIQLTN
jgi:hypothetical protein